MNDKYYFMAASKAKAWFSPSPEELGEGGPLAVDEGLLPGREPMLKIYVCEA